MNREEAIRRLRYIRMDYLGYPPFLEPIDMAIEALSSSDALLKQEIDFHKEVSRIEAEKVVDLEHKLADMVSIVQCKDCKYKCLYDYDDDEPEYYYCALEDRPNRNWSVDDTDFCSWGERREP